MQPTPIDGTTFKERFGAIQDNVEQVVHGKSAEVRLALLGLVAEGHLLIEDVPGVGKTMLAKAIARSIDCSFRRIQFTPDLLPTDITGVNVYSREQGDFEFRPGAIFANIVLGDEINRASPKTQSALLECMEERQATVDGVSHHLGIPFMVLATQNPIEHEGTYPLPEAQLDRFMLRLAIGYPSIDAETRILGSHGGVSILEQIGPVSDAATVAGLITYAQLVHVAEPVRRYIVELADATRRHPDLHLGASPRAALHLVRAARALAATEGRDFVIPDDVKGLGAPVLAHRLILSPDAAMSARTAGSVIAELLEDLPVPVGHSR